MPRLLFICPGVPGGVRSYIVNLTAFLKKAGVEYAILFYGSGNGMTTTKIPGEVSYSTRITFSRYASMRSIYKELAGLIAADDILICSDSLELEAINDLKIENKTVFILHGDLDHYNEVLKRNEAVLDHVFCVSHGLREKYGQRYAHLAFSVCHPLVANFTGKREYFKEGPLLGIFIGRFEYMKGADVFIEVVKGADKKQIPMRWKIFATGKGSEKRWIAEIPEQVELAFDTPNEKILRSLEDADLLLFPSRSEGFGIVVLEGMKRGVVPIARNLPIGIPDMIKDGETGYLADEAEDILKIIEDLSKDRRKLDRMREQALRFSGEAFDYEKAGAHFMANVEKLRQQPMRTKVFSDSKERNIERLLPESVYRFMKWMHNTVKYGRRASA